MEASNQTDYLLKIAIAGDTGVGKTTFLLKYMKDKFESSHIPTIGVEFAQQTLNIRGKQVKLQIWDTAGQERYRSITQAYFKGAKSVLILYSITKRSSFENIQNWIKIIQSYQSEDITPIIYLIGNKSDLEEERQVAFSEGETIAKEFNLTWKHQYLLVRILRKYFKILQKILQLRHEQKIINQNFFNNSIQLLIFQYLQINNQISYI